MEEKASLLSYQESIDELKQKLIDTTAELESVRVQAIEEMRESEKYVKHWLQVLEIACHERDEARDQLQRLLNEGMPSTTTAEFSAALPQLEPKSPLLNPAKATSIKVESNTLFEPFNYLSHGSSPIVSIFDAVSSPQLSNMNGGDSSNLAFVNDSFVQDYGGIASTGLASSGTCKIDEGLIVIDNLVEGKTLPQKGKLLQAVLEAGPLLQTLLLAGPLPKWRNPPPPQPFQIPPVQITGCDAELLAQKPAAISSLVVSKPLNFSSNVEMPCGGSKILSTSALSFESGPSSYCLGHEGLISEGANVESYIPTGKRQKFQ
ncbi:uncharacterized protein LOC132269489 [Cornus florida]|uniref:uncharacterized protein LOC132269489 n=1 Tax=Cornus florida TaxID=4283 RepID=UPI002898CE8C|nr:uncharacterized protein LOC132269489 [Cornus florida]